jgi:hypothetical protein
MPKFYCGATSAVLLLCCVMIECSSAALHIVLFSTVRFGKRVSVFTLYGLRSVALHSVALCGLAPERGGGARFCRAKVRPFTVYGGFIRAKTGPI